MAWRLILEYWKYLKDLFALQRTIVVVVLAILGIIGTIRDHFFPGKDIALINWIPPFPWYLWVIGILASLLVFSIESGFRIQKKLREQMRPGLQITYDPQSCLKITGKKYLFSVVVESIFHSVAGVIVGLETFDGIEKFGHLNRPFRFKHYDIGQLTCNPGEKISVNVLFFEDGEKGSAPNLGRLCLLFQGEMVSLPGLGPYTMTLRATGGGALPDYKSYRIGVQSEIPFMESI